MLIIEIILTFLLIGLSVGILYLAGLGLVYLFVKPVREYPLTLPRLKFAVIVPAHNEELSISQTLDNLKKLDYPESLYEVIVIVDNCSDRTLEKVKLSGNKFIERCFQARGKGYTLNYAFKELLEQDYDAFVIVDADSKLSHDFLKEMNTRLLAGEKVVQAFNGILNPEESPLTYMFSVGNLMENKLFYEAKSRIGLPINLRGNGMCFSREILVRFPWNAYSISEDTEYGLNLIKRGIKINYSPEAKVLARQPRTLSQAFNQRLRWASGNIRLTKFHALKLMLNGLVKKDMDLFDTGLGLLVLSKPFLILLSGIVLLFSSFIWFINPETGKMFLFWVLGLFLIEGFYFGVGIHMADLNSRNLKFLLYSPLFIFWFVRIALIGIFDRGRRSWLKSSRI